MTPAPTGVELPPAPPAPSGPPAPTNGPCDPATSCPFEVSGFVVSDSASRQIRMGRGVVAGDSPARVVVSGKRLNDLISATALCGATAMPGTFAGVTATQANLDFVIAASGPTGSCVLNVQGPSGTTVVPGTLALSEITAAAGVGSDTAAGTSSEPFKTFTRARAVLPAGGTVLLKAGTYDEVNNGEVYTLNDVGGGGAPSGPTGLPTGVTIRGEGSVLLDGGSSVGRTGRLGIVSYGGVTLEGLKFTGFQRAIVVMVGSAQLRTVIQGGEILQSDIDGVLAMAVSDVFANGTVFRLAGAPVSLLGSAWFYGDNVSINAPTGALAGVLAQNFSRVVLRNNSTVQVGGTGDALRVTDNATACFMDSMLITSGGSGVAMHALSADCATGGCDRIVGWKSTFNGFATNFNPSGDTRRCNGATGASGYGDQAGGGINWSVSGLDNCIYLRPTSFLTPTECN